MRSEASTNKWKYGITSDSVSLSVEHLSGSQKVQYKVGSPCSAQSTVLCPNDDRRLHTDDLNRKEFRAVQKLRGATFPIAKFLPICADFHYLCGSLRAATMIMLLDRR